MEKATFIYHRNRWVKPFKLSPHYNYAKCLKEEIGYYPIKCEISESMKEEAEKRFLSIIEEKPELKGKMNNETFMDDGKGTVHGFIGEYLIRERYKNDLKFTADTELGLKGVDFVARHGWTVDVKTKYATYKETPGDDYLASVTLDSFNRHDTDIYIFCRVYRTYIKTVDGRDMYDYPHGWIIGWMHCNDFYPTRKGKMLLKHEKEGNNGYEVQADCLNMKHKDLYKMF